MYESAFNICIIRSDGTGQTQLVRGTKSAFSPDGTRICYRAKVASGEQSFSMDLDGNDIQPMTKTAVDEPEVVNGSDQQPNLEIIPIEIFRWYILFPGNIVVYGIDDGVYIINTDGTGHRRITKQEGTICDGPDMFGCYIYKNPQELTSGNMVYVSDGDICVMNVDGTKILYLTFPADMNMSVAKINLIDSDGSNHKTLATGFAPKFSEAGDEIFYLSDGQLCRMNADGLAQQRVTEEFEEISDFAIVYYYDRESKDTLESCIILIAKKDGVCNIYMFNPADGTVAPYTENESPEVKYDNLTYLMRRASLCTPPRLVKGTHGTYLFRTMKTFGTLIFICRPRFS